MGGNRRDMNSITNLSAAELRKAANIQEKIQDLKKELGQLLGNEVSIPAQAPEAPKKRKKVSAAGRARMRKAQLARWAKIKGKAAAAKPAKKFKRKLTPAMKAALEKAWAARRAKKA
jgi:hypothetical protein